MAKSMFYAAKELTQSGHSLKAALTHLLAQHDRAVTRKQLKQGNPNNDVAFEHDDVAAARDLLKCYDKIAMKVPPPVNPKAEVAKSKVLAKALAKAVQS